MLLAKHLPAEQGWDVRLLATDISNRVLEKACKGTYPIARAAELPKDLLHSFMLRGMAERQGEMKVKVEIQQMVDFRKVNLNQDPDLSEGPFDAIFCRNVLIYFDLETKKDILTEIHGSLFRGGYLLLGTTELGAPVGGSFGRQAVGDTIAYVAL